MTKKVLLSLVMLVSLIAAGCSSVSTQTVGTVVSSAQTALPTAQAAAPTLAAALPTAAAQAQETAAPLIKTAQPTLEAAATALSTALPQTGATAAAAAATAVATIVPENLVRNGYLTICTDFPYPPQEFYDANGNPDGSDIDIGNEIARRLQLKPTYVNSVFDTIIAAVTSGKCDIIISAMNITPDRNKKVSMIPYFQAGQAFVVQKGNPLNINGPMDLCGKSVAAESGTTEADYLQGVGTYQSQGGLTQECTKAGKQGINTVITQKDTDALQQLQAGKVAAYFADSPVAAYYTVQHPNQFQLAGQVIQPIKEGIALPCGQSDCTNAPLTPLGDAIDLALKSMMADGTYMKILDKWNLASGAVNP